jgi:hypothetical protein
MSDRGATQTSFIEIDPTGADTAPPLFPRSKSVSISFLYSPINCQQPLADDDAPDRVSTESSTLLSGHENIDADADATSKKSVHSQSVDITGLALLNKPEFWQIWVLMGLLTGVGLMTIK